MKSRPVELEDGRVRRRIDAMRRVQMAALDLAELHGWANVTIDEIAARAGVGPATVYRNFATKERIVLWDDYDPMLLDAVRAALVDEPVLQAVRDALVASLDRVYEEDKHRILRRAKLIFDVPRLGAAAEENRVGLRSALSKLFIAAGAFRRALDADVAAGAIVATLEVAVAHWVHERGRRPLRVHLNDAFRALAALGRTR